MNTDDNENDSDPVANGLFAFGQEMLREPRTDSGEPRDTAGVRWLKFGLVIAVPALIFGLTFSAGFMLSDTYREQTAKSSYQREKARHRLESYSAWSMKSLFWSGCAVGGGLGVIYVSRCVMKDVDP